MVDYLGFIAEMKASFEQFEEAATKGEKRKNSALEARKLSHKIGKDMGAFRKMSIANDQAITEAKKAAQA